MGLYISFSGFLSLVFRLQRYTFLRVRQNFFLPCRKKCVLLHPVLTHCPGGGMVDTVDSKSAAGNGVRVQVPPGVLRGTCQERLVPFFCAHRRRSMPLPWRQTLLYILIFQPLPRGIRHSSPTALQRLFYGCLTVVLRLFNGLNRRTTVKQPLNNRRTAVEGEVERRRRKVAVGADWNAVEKLFLAGCFYFVYLHPQT